ncbi:cupin domain-containing protein [Variovorax sp. J2P1-59]|uniref:cupin domain-containing protein n=1 Tax=Variovorax flavidus TaxID=3053501 RepID=UPI0025765BC3|nr:cupin domain-containing protein [Variovorax sp. J2P1-59]MDM0078741.1 cupin domain-containing protein [Variovorax sp. J2P1-59]
MTLPTIQRVVTGHDAQGKAIISSNGPLPVVTELKTLQGVVFHEVWNTAATPARIDNGADPTLGPITLPPPKHGTRIRFVDIPPDDAELLARSAEQVRAGFSEIGDAGASTIHKGAPHPLMHRTQSVDYGIVIEGELTLIVDEGEVIVGPGSVVIQRGTNHAWANRSGKICRILFILIDGEFGPGLGKLLAV